MTHLETLLLSVALALACPAPSPPLVDDPCHGADVNCDFAVNVYDVIEMLLNWGGEHEACDIDDDNVVGVLDLIIVLENWGCCNLCAEPPDRESRYSRLAGSR